MRQQIVGEFRSIGKVVKPSYDVKVGDVIEIKFGDKVSKFEVLQVPEKVGQELGELIKIV